MEELTKKLEEIGLTNAESQVYLGLLKLGEARVGQIIDLAKVSSSNVHDALDKLVKRGLVSFVVKNNIKEYFPSSPENLKVILNKEKELIKEKEGKLNSLLVGLLSIQKISEPSQNAEVYMGLNGIKSGFKKLLQTVHRGQEFIFFYKYDELNVEVVHEFFSKMDIEDYYNKLPTRGIFSKEYKKFFKDRKKNKIKAKFTEHPIPSSVNIYGDKVLIIAWREDPIGFLIQSKEVTQTFEELFEDIWKVS